MIYSGPSAKPHDSGVAVAIIIAKAGKVLLMKREGGSTGQGTWAIPGGRVDFMEDPMDAASRELQEETGLVTSNFELIGYSNDKHTAELLHYVTFTLFATTFSGTPKIMEPHKCSEMDWFAIDKLPSPLFEPTAQKLTDEKAKYMIRESQ